MKLSSKIYRYWTSKHTRPVRDHGPWLFHHVAPVVCPIGRAIMGTPGYPRQDNRVMPSSGGFEVISQELHPIPKLIVPERSRVVRLLIMARRIDFYDDPDAPDVNSRVPTSTLSWSTRPATS